MSPGHPSTQLEPSACRLCGDGRIQWLGALPESDCFAGRILQHSLAGGHLWECKNCQSMFRHPILPDAAYLALYANGTADEWNGDGGREDLAIIRRIIARQAPSRGVLDVGCGAGDFLLTLPARLTKYGVEPSVAAAGLAKARGVSILAPTLAQLSPQVSFDVITLIDVIEHVANPRDLLDRAVLHLAPGGSLIIATGDPGNVLWRRVFRSRFWYSSFPEHISFPSLRYFRSWHEGKKLLAPVQIRLKYRRIPARLAALYCASQIAYLVSPGLLNLAARGIERLRRAPLPRRRFFSPGAPGVFTDHQIVTIARIPAG